MSLAGKVALVTGAAQGLGKAFSEVLLQRGAKVCVADVNPQIGEATLKEFHRVYSPDKAFFVSCDVTSEADFSATFDAVKDRYGSLDIVVNNAGIADRSKWRSLIDINVKGVIEGTIQAVKAMRKDKGGNGGLIVNVASLAGLVPVPSTPEYAASKWGVMGYTLSWAEHPALDSLGLSFAVMCPAFADTPMVQSIQQDAKALESFKPVLDAEGIMPVTMVTEAFEQLLDTPDINGSVVVARKNAGIHIKKHRRNV